MSKQETSIIYRCPHCRLSGSDSREVIPFGKRREKHRGGRFTEYHVGMCKDCGMLYSYKQVESSIFARKDYNEDKDS